MIVTVKTEKKLKRTNQKFPKKKKGGPGPLFFLAPPPKPTSPKNSFTPSPSSQAKQIFFLRFT